MLLLGFAGLGFAFRHSRRKMSMWCLFGNGTSGMKVCPECHGQGRIEDEDGNIVTCPECHGSGVVDDHHDDDPGRSESLPDECERCPRVRTMPPGPLFP